MDDIIFNEFDGWDPDNSSAIILIGLKEKDFDNFQPDTLLFQYGLDSDDGELQNYTYSSDMNGLDIIAKHFGFDVHKNNLDGFDNLVGIFENFNLDYFWFFDGSELKYVSDYYLQENQDLVEKIINKSEFFISTVVSTTSDDESW